MIKFLSRLISGPLTPDVKMIWKTPVYLGKNGNSYSQKFYHLIDRDGSTFICRRATETEREKGGDEFYVTFNGYFPVTELEDIFE